MKLVKCPRCDLNYMREGDKYCKICMRDLKGDSQKEEIELCSICNESPVLPGKDVCLFCLKEMEGQKNGADGENDDMESRDPSDLDDLDENVDDMLPDLDEEELPEQEISMMEEELSLESVREDEENEENEDDEEEEL